METLATCEKLRTAERCRARVFFAAGVVLRLPRAGDLRGFTSTVSMKGTPVTSGTILERFQTAQAVSFGSTLSDASAQGRFLLRGEAIVYYTVCDKAVRGAAPIALPFASLLLSILRPPRAGLGFCWCVLSKLRIRRFVGACFQA